MNNGFNLGYDAILYSFYNQGIRRNLYVGDSLSVGSACMVETSRDS